MSDPVNPAPPLPPSAAASRAHAPDIRVVSHSGLFYWWPIWAFGLLFALLTYVDGHRMAILPPGAELKFDKTANNSVITMVGEYPQPEELQAVSGKDGIYQVKPRVTTRTWMGPIYLCIIAVVMLITNVPLRGLWSLVIIISFVVLALLLSLMHWWSHVLGAFGDLHIYINMGGYLFLGVLTLIAWIFVVMVFDNRSYIMFTAGQIKVCEEVGGRERVYDTTGLTIEKQRDDWFRHIILGFGSGDLTVKTSGADRQAIVMPNVAFIGFKIGAIERLIRERQMK